MSALPIRSQPSAVARVSDQLIARRSEIRAEQQQLATRLRSLAHEESRIVAMLMLGGVEVGEDET